MEVGLSSLYCLAIGFTGAISFTGGFGGSYRQISAFASFVSVMLFYVFE